MLNKRFFVFMFASLMIHLPFHAISKKKVVLAVYGTYKLVKLCVWAAAKKDQYKNVEASLPEIMLFGMKLGLKEYGHHIDMIKRYARCMKDHIFNGKKGFFGKTMDAGSTVLGVTKAVVKIGIQATKQSNYDIICSDELMAMIEQRDVVGVQHYCDFSQDLNAEWYNQLSEHRKNILHDFCFMMINVGLLFT